MKIGVFDSGVGGKAIAVRLQELIPTAEIVSVDDHKHVPYGSRSPEEIIALTSAAIQPLLKARCDVIVLACNTATTIAITSLRELYPKMKFVGIEPMIKPAAALTKSHHIGVLATPATLASARYNELKETWAANIQVDEPDCSQWATLIEEGRAEEVPLDAIMTSLKDRGADVIVLACTHYHWLKTRIKRLAGPEISILEPSDAISQRIQSVVSTRS